MTVEPANVEKLWVDRKADAVRARLFLTRTPTAGRDLRRSAGDRRPDRRRSDDDVGAPAPATDESHLT
jgi:hypothetical protein